MMVLSQKHSKRRCPRRCVIGYGAFLDFRGAGVSTITAPVSGISTLFITGGGGGGSISISTTPPASPGAGDLWYSPDRARTFIYYDESEVGYGTSKQWIDASPFNVGVLTGHSLSVANLTVIMQPWYFNSKSCFRSWF